MKTRSGFVSNSSSSSFIIINKTDKDLNLLDFAIENRSVFDDFISNYQYDYTFDDFIESVEANNIVIPVGRNVFSFADEDRTICGIVYDYGLREGGNSKRFKWALIECRGQEYDPKI